MPLDEPHESAPSKEAIAVIIRALEDATRLIAATKIQRWEIVKWVITINIALSSTTFLLKSNQAAMLFIALSLMISTIGWALIRFHNRRIARAREAHFAYESYLAKHVCDVRAISGHSRTQQKGSRYDREELNIFAVSILLSILPLLGVAWHLYYATSS